MPSRPANLQPLRLPASRSGVNMLSETTDEEERTRPFVLTEDWSILEPIPFGGLGRLFTRDPGPLPGRDGCSGTGGGLCISESEEPKHLEAAPGRKCYGHGESVEFQVIDRLSATCSASQEPMQVQGRFCLRSGNAALRRPGKILVPARCTWPRLATCISRFSSTRSARTLPWPSVVVAYAQVTDLDLGL